MLELLPENLQAIQSHLQNLGWIEPATTLANPRPAGDGNMNRTLRFDCVGPASGRDSIILKQAVPFVAKYPSIAAPIERGAAEAAFYCATAEHAALAARLPGLLGIDQPNHLLAFSDLGGAVDLSAAYSTPDIANRLPVIMPVLLDWLTQLHAIAPPEKLVNLCMRELNHTHIFDVPLKLDNGLELGELAEIATEFANDKALKVAATELGNIYVGLRGHASPPALLHGDFYPGSWLAELSGTTPVVHVIDPEFAFVGPAEFDVGVCLAHLQFAGMTPAEAQRCIAAYNGSTAFDMTLAEGFAGIEIIRRLLGVAQLPLSPNANTTVKAQWLNTARQMVLASPL